MQPDKRPDVVRPTPYNKLSEAEEQRIIDTCLSSEFIDTSAAFVVNTLLDRRIYLASESTVNRIMAKRKLNAKRGLKREHIKHHEPDTFTAKKPGEVLTWDITYLPSQVKGLYFYLYMIQDLHSRKGVGYEVYSEESGEHAAALLERTLLSEGITRSHVVLHSDNGAPMKSQAMHTKMRELDVISSHSRPRVSNDNAFIESFFGTMKYHVSWPRTGFKTLEEARQWVEDFMQWYNYEHKHSQLNYVTPNERHTGQDKAILAKRKQVVLAAKAKHPERWAQDKIRDFTPVLPTSLNPKKLTSAAEIKIAA